IVVEKYSYDNNGNRASATVNGITTTGNYTLDDQLEVYGNNAYRYDDDGYLIEKITPDGTTTYDYGTLGELKSVTSPTKTISYQQNASNQRVAKKVDGIIVEKYLWEDISTLLAIYNKDDNLLQRFDYTDSRMPISMTMGTDKYYLHYDQVGSPRAVSDSSGNIIKEVIYDTFGNILSDSNEAFKIPFGFAGGLYDSDTKLTRFGYRDYDAFTGKWTAKDPIIFDGGDSNLYGYILGDPINSVDPDGLFGRYIFKKIFGGGKKFKKNPIKPRQSPIKPRQSPIKPRKRKGVWTCAAVACCNDNIPDNCSTNPKQQCKQAVWKHKNRSIAVKEAEDLARIRLGCQPKHVQVYCTGPKGQQWQRKSN
ncbi:MAG: RHS repeat-associated core domain-containing protein, partial [Sulfurovum sp.]